MRSFFVIILGLIAAVYLLNPTSGIIELIPDNFPIIGNLDEATAAVILINVFDYFGLSLSNLLKRPPPGR